MVDVVDLPRDRSCTQLLRLVSARVGIDGESLQISLNGAKRVCAPPRFEARLAAPTFPSPPRCVPGQLLVRDGFSHNEDNGSFDTELWFVNRSKAACVLGGYPTVQGMEGSGGRLVGPRAKRQVRSGPMVSGWPTFDLSYPGETLVSFYTHVGAQSPTPTNCAPEFAAGIMVSGPGLPSTYLKLPAKICTRIDANSVSFMYYAQGIDGLSPNGTAP